MHVRSFAGHVVGISLQALIVAAIVAALAFGAALVTGAPSGGSDVLAGKPVAAATATLSASPNPVPAYGSEYTVTGCGYVVGKQVNMLINEGMFFAVGVDSSGCISFSWYSGSPGTYSIEAYQNLKGKRQTLMGSTTLTVVG